MYDEHTFHTLIYISEKRGKKSPLLSSLFLLHASGGRHTNRFFPMHKKLKVSQEGNTRYIFQKIGWLCIASEMLRI